MVLHGIGTLNLLTGALAAQAPRATRADVVQELILLVRETKHAQWERVQAVVDGAVLAVEQIQDKRIDLLEKGPEVTVRDVLFDLLLGLAFAGVGKMLLPLTESIAKELVHSATSYAQLGKSKKMFRSLRFVASLADAGFAENFGYGAIGRDELVKYNEAIRQVLTSTVSTGLERATQIGLEKGEALARDGRLSPVRNVDLDSGDSPGVAVLQAAQTYASNQRAAIGSVFGGFEEMLRTDPTPETVEAIRAAADVPPLAGTLSEIRSRNKIVFEAVIWAKLFELEKTPSWKPGGLFDTRIQLPGVSSLLMDYWVRRFGPVVEEWLSGAVAGAVSGQQVQGRTGIDPRNFGYRPGDQALRPGAFDNPTPIPGMEGSNAWNPGSVQRDATVKFMHHLTREIASLEAAGVGAGSMTIQSPPRARDGEGT